MSHLSLAALKQQFDEHQQGGYGWLESRNDSAKKLLLLHGVTGGKEDMLPLAVDYEAKGYHVYCVDLPGHGGSEWHDDADFDALARWLAEFIKTHGPFSRIIGNSFSSAVVYHYLKRYETDDAMRVTLCCPTPDISRLSTSVYKLGNWIPYKSGWYLYTTWAANLIRFSLAAKQFNPRAMRWLLESEARKRRTILPEAGMKLSTLLFIENPFSGESLRREMQKRTTIIMGTRDNVITKRTRALLQALLPASNYIEAPRAGHILHFEAVDVVQQD